MITLEEGIRRVLLGEALADLALDCRLQMLVDSGLEPHEAHSSSYRTETKQFVNRLCRALAERHGGDRRVLAALLGWVDSCDEYDVFDALLSSFHFAGRERIVARGRQLFPGPLTAHW